MSESGYLPSEYVDDVCPPLRAHPDLWLVRSVGTDGLWLAGCESDADDGVADVGVALAIGDAVSFTPVTHHDSIIARLRRDGTWFSRYAIPAGANSFVVSTALETIASSMAELARDYAREREFDEDSKSEKVEVLISTWGEPEEWHITSAGGVASFERVAHADA